MRSGPARRPLKIITQSRGRLAPASMARVKKGRKPTSQKGCRVNCMIFFLGRVGAA